MRNGLWRLCSSPQPSHIKWSTIEMPLASQPTVHQMLGRVHPPRSTIRRTILVECMRTISCVLHIIFIFNLLQSKSLLEWLESSTFSLFRYFSEAHQIIFCWLLSTQFYRTLMMPLPFPVRIEWTFIHIHKKYLYTKCKRMFFDATSIDGE